jgi:amino-acid N-acetyltransferase
MEAYDIGTAVAADGPEIERLLARSGLPVEGLAGHWETVLVAREPGRIIGCAALEVYHDAALLRSVAVEPSRQGSGVGTAVTVAALALAHRRRVRRVYLLTETAAEFFSRFGFAPVTRGDVPDPVKRSEELTHLCPESATVMLLELRAEGAGDAKR